MRRLLAALVSSVILLAAIASFWVPSAAADTPPVIDRSGTDSPGLTSSVTETMQVTQPNALLFFYWPGAASATLPIVSFTSTPPLTWQNPPFGGTGDGGSLTPTQLFWAADPNAGPVTVTMTFSGNIGRYFKVFWFDILGANLASPFDPNPSLPASDPCCPQGNPNTISGVSTTYPNDLLIAFEQETSGSNPSNIPTFNAPWSEIVTNLNSGYSIAMSWAYFQSPGVISGATYAPVTWAQGGLTRGNIFAIRAGVGGVSTVTNTATVTTTSCTSTVTSTILGAVVTVTTTTTVTFTNCTATVTTICYTCPINGTGVTLAQLIEIGVAAAFVAIIVARARFHGG